MRSSTKGDGEDLDEPPWTDRLRELPRPAMRDVLERSGIEGSGAYNYYDSQIRRGQVFLEYEIALARKLLSCNLDICRVDEVCSGFGQLMFLLGCNGFRTVGFEVNPMGGRMAVMLRGTLERVDAALTGNIRLIGTEFPCRFAPQPVPGSMVLTTNLVASCSRLKQLAVQRAMRRNSFVLADVQRFFDYRPEPRQEPEALALFADAGLREPELFLELGAGGRYYLFVNPAPRGCAATGRRVNRDRLARQVLQATGHSAEAPCVRVLALGSCRVDDPLIAVHRLGEIDYLNRRIALAKLPS